MTATQTPASAGLAIVETHERRRARSRRQRGSLICSVRGIVHERTADLLGYAPWSIEQSPHLDPLDFVIPSDLDRHVAHELRSALTNAALSGEMVEVHGWAEALGDVIIFHAVRVVRDIATASDYSRRRWAEAMRR